VTKTGIEPWKIFVSKRRITALICPKCQSSETAKIIGKESTHRAQARPDENRDSHN
jgi:hypothetical protein